MADFITIDTASVFISKEAIIEDDVIIYPNNYIEGNCVIKKGTVLLPNNFISNSTIGEQCKISNSVIEASFIDDGVSIGPFAHIRPNSKILKNVKIGNFVEVKNSIVKDKTKISHLSYVGDAEVGKNVNIGCGVVFVNYNGRIKQKTTIEDGSFIGSSVNLIAPVHIGEKAFICAGTTIDKDVSSGDFVIGRSRMNIKEGKARFYLKGED
ncbi:MAG: hypothetical protein IKC11_02280 [Clostridia bacterium]|nr:hypothetical protein [Clostridia bacterium]